MLFLFVDVAIKQLLFCRYNATELSCTSQISSMTTTRGGGTVRLIIDGRNFDVVGFDYENDPVYSDISPQFFFKSYVI